jgi:hypothetical protein
MLCSKVRKRLSEFYDGVLGADASVQVVQHLKQCESCRKELDALEMLHDRLNSLKRIPAPDYLFNLVQNQLENRRKYTWRVRFKDAVSLYWSRIRTTEGLFYWTRALGTLTTALFFCLISSSIDPFYTTFQSPVKGRSVFYMADSKNFCENFSRNFGVISPESYKRNDRYDPAINDQWLLDFGKNVSTKADEEAFTIVTAVDSNGSATIQNVVESSDDQDLLDSFNDMISLAQFRPAINNGQIIKSQWIMKFSKITVYE